MEERPYRIAPGETIFEFQTRAATEGRPYKVLGLRCKLAAKESTK